MSEVERLYVCEYREWWSYCSYWLLDILEFALQDYVMGCYARSARS